MNSALKDRACSRWPGWLPGSRRVRLHDGSPVRDVTRSVVVGGASVSTPQAPEVVPGATVPLVDMPALGALPRRVTRVHQCHRNPSDRGLVADELAELVERPGVQVGPLGLLNRHPIADTAQVFELDPASGVFGRPNELLGDAMVDIPRVAGFLAAALLQQPLGGFAALGLQLGAELVVAAADRPHGFSAVGGAVGVGGKVDHPEVHAEPPVRLPAAGRLGHVDDDGEVPRAVANDEAGLPAHGSAGNLGPAALVDDSDDDATRQGEDRDRIAALPGKDALVVLDRTVRAERGFDVLVPLVRLAGFRDGADAICALSRKSARRSAYTIFCNAILLAVRCSNATSATRLAASLQARMVADNIAICSPVGASFNSSVTSTY